MRVSFSLAALVGSLLGASPGLAQTRPETTAQASGTILETNSLTKIEDLDFGTIAADDTDPGTVTIDADSGALSGVDVFLLPGDFQRGQFRALGLPAAVIDLALVQPAGAVLMNSNGDSIGAVLSLNSGGGSRMVPTSGVITLYVGGVFSIAAQQPNGVYNGDFHLTANFP